MRRAINGVLALSRWRLTVARLTRAHDGATAIEMAILLPAFLLFLFGIIEFGRALWTQMALQYTVEEAARCAAINTTTCGTKSATQSYAAARAFGLTIPAGEFTASGAAFNEATPACGTQVSVSHGFDSVVARLIPQLSVTLRAKSCHP